jgi:hypothetical protein
MKFLDKIKNRYTITAFRVVFHVVTTLAAASLLLAVLAILVNWFLELVLVSLCAIILYLLIMVIWEDAKDGKWL